MVIEMDYEHKRRNVNSNCNNPEQIDIAWGGDNGNNIADAVENEGYADVASLLVDVANVAVYPADGCDHDHAASVYHVVGANVSLVMLLIMNLIVLLLVGWVGKAIFQLSWFQLIDIMLVQIIA